jgi:hypothetical protein
MGTVDGAGAAGLSAIGNESPSAPAIPVLTASSKPILSSQALPLPQQLRSPHIWRDRTRMDFLACSPLFHIGDCNIFFLPPHRNSRVGAHIF